MPKQKIAKPDIIKNALVIFKSSGYHNTTMANIGAACGLLKGSIYHYFPSKEQLMVEVLEFLALYYQEKVFSISSQKELNPKEKINFLVQKSEEIFLKDSGGCLMASIGLETAHLVSSFKQPIQKFFNDWMFCFEEIFAEIYPEIEAKNLAERCVAQMEGAVLLMQIFQNPEYLHRTHLYILNLIKTSK